MFQKFQNAILLAPVVENLLELATIAFMLNYSKSFLPVHYERPISGMAFPVADDKGFWPEPNSPPINAPDQIRQLPVFQAIVQTVFKL